MAIWGAKTNNATNFIGWGKTKVHHHSFTAITKHIFIHNMPADMDIIGSHVLHDERSISLILIDVDSFYCRLWSEHREILLVTLLP